MQAHLTHRDISAAQAFADTPAPTTALFNTLLATAGKGGAPMRQAVPLAGLKRLIAARAWNDAALALLALQLPDWQLRRLAYDAGEWHCALSRARAMPEWLDETTETHHPNMALAILGALVAAAADSAADGAASRLTAVRSSHPDEARFEPMLCEHFA